MKITVKSPWRLGIASVILGCSLAATSAAGGFGKPAPTAAAALKAAHKARGVDACNPISPMETKLSLSQNPQIGQPITLTFDVMTFEKGEAAEVRFETSLGVQLNGIDTERGTFDANRSYRFQRQIVVSRPGRFEISAQAIAGVPEYRFGRRNRYYLDASATGIVVSETPIGQATDSDPESPAPVFSGNEPRRLFTPDSTLLLPETEIPTLDPNGQPLDRTAGTTDAISTVYGYWRYRHTGGNVIAGYGTAVEAWDYDEFSADDFLGSVAAGPDGYFEITFDNDTDGGLEPGTADVYLRFRTTNSKIRTYNENDDIYSTQTGVLFWNIPGGSHNAGSWYADWGTAGVSDHNERAFQLQDVLTRSWSAGVGFGHNAHQTFCRWHLGNNGAGSSYNREANRITMSNGHVSSPDVIHHEYAHSYHDSMNGNDDWPPGAGGAHSFTGHYTDGLALTEGYATYYSCAAQGDDWIYNDNNPLNLINFNCDSNWDGHGAANGNSDDLSNAPNHGYDTESAVLAFLLDIADSRNSPTDPYDWINMGHDEIHDIFRNHMVSGHHLHSIRDFYAGWYARNHPYRPKINGQMMIHGMKQAGDRPVLGLNSGISTYTGTWYFGGYGRANFTVKNYGSQTYQLDRLYIWATEPGGEDIPGFGGDGNNDPLTSGSTRQILKSYDHVGMNSVGTVIANPRYGNYRFRAGFYRPGNIWTLLDPAEAGTDRDILKNVVEDTTGPTLSNVLDDGTHQWSRTTMRVRANATELQSSIRSFWVRIGTAPGGSNVLGWTEYTQFGNNVFNRNIVIPQQPIGTTLYATVVARNIEGLDSPFVNTDGITIANPEIEPFSRTITRGIVVANNTVEAVRNSDNVRMEIRPGVVFSTALAPIELTFTGAAPLLPLSAINLKVESAAPPTVAIKIEMRDYVTNEWVVVRDQNSSNTDTLYQHNQTTNPSRFISVGGAVACRISYKPTGPVFAYPWLAKLDWVHWTITP